MAGSNDAIASAPTREPRLRASALARIRLSQVWAITAVAIPVMRAQWPLATIDLAYHLRAGEIMLDTHAVLRTDVFSAAAYGKPWLNQQWLAQVILAATLRLGGWFGLVVLRALLVALVLTLVFLACRAVGAATKRAAWLTVASGLPLAAGFMLRPQLFGMVCFAGTAWLVARRRTHPEGVWLVVPLTILWANVHGSFFLAPLLLGLAWVEDRWVSGRASRTLLLAGIGSLLATMVNPYTYRVWSYAIDLATNPVIRATIVEWQPPTIQTYTGIVFFLSVVAVAGVLIGRVRRPVPWASLLPLVVFLAISLAAIRGVWWWAMVVPIVLAGVLSERPTKVERRDPAGLQNAAIVGLLAVATLSAMIRWMPYTGREMPEGDRLAFAPVGITHELERTLRPGELMFNAQEWGSWFEYEFPRNLVMFDSLIELTPPRVWWQYADVSHGVQGWQATLSSWDVDLAVLARERQPDLIAKMRTDPGWQLVYEDADGAIFRPVSTPAESGRTDAVGGAFLPSSR
jgi:hypothetical protein